MTAEFTGKLRDSERKYNVLDRELMALHLRTSHLCFLLEGCSFTTYVAQKIGDFRHVQGD